MFNDLKAPRFKQRKYRTQIVTKEFYDRWKLANPQYKITFTQFKKLCENINKEIIEFVVEEPDGVRLPTGMGDIYLGYVPNGKKRPIDYKATKEHGKTIYHENWNSSGKLGKIIYGVVKKRYKFKRSRFWSFKGSTSFRHAAIKAFQDNPERYKNTIEKRDG